MTPWLLVDYGEVISLPYDPEALAAIEAVLGDVTGYWTHRPAYDAGQPSSDYWSLVAGRSVGADDVARLDEIDLWGWGRIDHEVLALLDEQRAAGTRLALLSNAPHDQADAFDRAPWASGFEHLFVSSRIGVVKPRPEVFAHVLDVLGAAPEDVTFVDDRAENVAAAAALGIRGVLFTGVADLRKALA